MSRLTYEYEDVVAWIHDRLKFGIRPGLIRVEELLNRLGNPQTSLKMVHIAGTNGKGSTTTFLRCLLEEQGLKVGTFTSPYIESFNERIAINGKEIPDEDLVALAKQVIPIVEEMDRDEVLSNTVEFEILTAMMLLYFKQKEVDIVLVEVGLGGLYDATNVITPLISVITTIGMDHMDILGHTIKEIAYQKAGIIKSHVPVVVGKVSDEAFFEIASIASEKHSVIKRLGVDFVGRKRSVPISWGEVFEYKSQELSLKEIHIPLQGKHQIDNASVAIEVFTLLSQMLYLPVRNRDYQIGLSKASWPGRMEKVSDEPLIVLDGAHNEAAIDVLVDNLKTEFKDKRVHIIFGALGTKDVLGMLQKLEEVKQVNLKVITFDFPKAMKQTDYEAIGIKSYNHWEQALIAVLSEVEGDDLVLMTGSLYFISQVRQTLLGG